MAEALRRAEADSGGSGLLARADSLRVVAELSLAVPQRRRARRRAASGPRRGDLAVHGRWAATSPGPPSTWPRPTSRPAGPTSCCVCGGEATAHPDPPAGARASSPTGPSRTTTCRAPARIGDDTPLVSDTESGAGPAAAGPRLPDVRGGPAGPPRARASTSTASGSGGCGRPSREVAATQPPRLDPAPPTPPTRSPSRRARQPDGLVPLHEAALLQQPGRPGRGPRPVLGRRGRAPPASPATAGCSSTPAPTPTTTGTSRTGPTCARRPRCGWPVATAHAPGGHLARRARPRRPLLVLPGGGADRRPRARAARRGRGMGRHRGPAPAHRDRRDDLRRRPLERLHEPRARHHGRRAPRRPGLARAVHRQRRASPPSTPWCCSRPSPPPGRSATPSPRTRSTPSPRWSSTTPSPAR